uniref:Uncharacterized protein n=1 Tax=Taeniopygia guttata TaxID=59729 RepID=A0A674GP16_TAEGU
LTFWLTRPKSAEWSLGRKRNCTVLKYMVTRLLKALPMADSYAISCFRALWKTNNVMLQLVQYLA